MTSSSSFTDTAFSFPFPFTRSFPNPNTSASGRERVCVTILPGECCDFVERCPTRRTTPGIADIDDGLGNFCAPDDPATTFLLDFSKNLINDEVLSTLLELVKEARVEESVERKECEGAARPRRVQICLARA